MSAISNREDWTKKVLEVIFEWGEPIRKYDVIRLVEDEYNSAYLSGLIDGLVMSGHIKAFKLDDQRETWLKITFLGMRLYDTL